MSARPMAHPTGRAAALILPLVLFLVGCIEAPTDPEALPSFAKGGSPPSSCLAYAPLQITMGDGAADGLVSDGGGLYQEGVAGVEAHVNEPTGNLSIWTTASTRHLVANTTSGTVNIDRAYTNSHSNSCGLRLSSLPASSSAVFEGEVRQGGTGSTIAKVRYGVTCSGAAQDANRVTIGYDNETGVITLTAPAGNYCRPGTKKNTWVTSAVAGFSMTMQVPTP